MNSKNNIPFPESLNLIIRPPNQQRNKNLLLCEVFLAKSRAIGANITCLRIFFYVFSGLFHIAEFGKYNCLIKNCNNYQQRKNVDYLIFEVNSLHFWIKNSLKNFASFSLNSGKFVRANEMTRNDFNFGGINSTKNFCTARAAWAYSLFIFSLIRAELSHISSPIHFQETGFISSLDLRVSISFWRSACRFAVRF